MINKLLTGKKYLVFLFLIGVLVGSSFTYGYFSFSGKEKFKNVGDLDSASARAYLKFKKIKKSFVPSGVPEIYGQEVDISFDEVQDAINRTKIYGPDYGKKGKKIALSGKKKERYIEITSQTACEYCCGLKALIREDGSAACGCDHSIMMRGLTAYLIKNHPEMTNQEILKEINDWKKTFFPKQTLTTHLQTLKQQGETGIDQILEEFPGFMPQMVGGC